MTRMIPLEGIENLRDFGDYGAGQRRLKRGRLYRSAHHANATDKDLEAMAALGLSVIVDLRRPNEREVAPSRRWPGFSAEVISNDIGQVDEDPWHSFIKSSDLSADAFRGYMVEYYRAGPYVDRHIDLFSRYFQALARADGPVLIHCAAGKDRTGMLAALTHHIGGVSDEDIVADFLLTNDEARFERRMPLMIAHIADLTGRAPSPEAARMAMGVEAQYLETAIAAMKASSGSLDAYLEKVLGVDARTRAAIETNILV
ncbi:MAG: protein tyrosine phosphatase [Caulobacter sp.]|nr:protein tyrosine phosphatase [Caulobacter sp.]